MTFAVSSAESPSFIAILWFSLKKLHIIKKKIPEKPCIDRDFMVQ